MHCVLHLSFTFARWMDAWAETFEALKAVSDAGALVVVVVLQRKVRYDY